VKDNDAPQSPGKSVLNILVLGAQSTIAEHCNRLLAQQGARFVLVGRDAVRLRSIADDLTARGASACHVMVMDLADADIDSHEQVTRWAGALGGRIDAAYVYFGILGDQMRARQDGILLRRILDTNFTAASIWCDAVAAQFEMQRGGALIVITSVAGDRGRQSNYAYGAAKAGLTVFVQGLAHRLHGTGASATAVKLGSVDTAMTSGVGSAGILQVAPGRVAPQLAALAKRGGKPILYLPWYWWPIMMIVSSIPARWFHRTRL
jgi:decaprenylphospho-beta-D-erythro-pentofuranosid-2-ulose 2-reductase